MEMWTGRLRPPTESHPHNLKEKKRKRRRQRKKRKRKKKEKKKPRKKNEKRNLGSFLLTPFSLWRNVDLCHLPISLFLVILFFSFGANTSLDYVVFIHFLFFLYPLLSLFLHLHVLVGFFLAFFPFTSLSPDGHSLCHCQDLPFLHRNHLLCSGHCFLLKSNDLPVPISSYPPSSSLFTLPAPSPHRRTISSIILLMLIRA